MFGFDSKDVFLVFPMFFCFEMENTNNTFFFLNGYDQSRSQKAKKTQAFFLFSAFQVWFSALKRIKNPNNLSFFVFLRYWLIVCMQTTKKLKFFFCFWRLKPEKTKTTQGKPPKKNNLLSQNQRFSSKFFFVFCFFGFPGISKTSGFVFFVFPRFLWFW